MSAALNESTKQSILYKAILSRRVEEALLNLYSEGKLFGTIHTCIGQEFSGATLSEHLQDGDSLFSNHRCHGHFLSMTNNVEGLVGELMGKSNGVCGGLGGSQHLCHGDFYSNGVQGGIVPVATGLAMARKLDKNNKISVVFVGDGTLGEGVLYESLNIASKWELPLLMVLENNGYSQSTSSEQILAGDIRDRAKAFAIKDFKGDTWDWENLYEVFAEAVAYVRENGKPAFVQVDTFRLMAHSKGDDNRDPAFVEQYQKKDPLNILLSSQAKEIASIDQKAKEAVRNAIDQSEKAPYLDLSRVPAFVDECEYSEWMPVKQNSERVLDKVNQAFHGLLANEKVLFIGEDIEDPYGGAFKATKGLLQKAGDRVFNTPLSEAAITGVGLGLAMSGYRPLVEIMFGDFSGLTFDQLLNHVGKFEFMYNQQVKTPLIVRTPMGGHRGYGPTHSQTLDRHFLGIPGLKVLALNELVEPKKVYERLVQSDRGATLVIENKIMYSQFTKAELPPGFHIHHNQEDFPATLIKADANHLDFTLIGYGGSGDLLVSLLDRMFEEHDLIGEALVPCQIYPINVQKFVETLKPSPALVFIEEGQNFANFSAEFMAQLSELGVHKPMLRVGPRATGIPASRNLEAQSLPTLENSTRQILSFLR